MRVGGYLQEQLKSLARRNAAVQEVRGRGLIQGLQLAIPARPIVEQALAEGVLFNSTQDTVLRFLPPFLLQEKHVDKGMRVLKKLLRKNRREPDDQCLHKMRRAKLPQKKQQRRYQLHRGCSGWSCPAK